MKSGPQTEPRFKTLKLDVILAFVALVIVIGLASWYAASHSSTSKGSSSIPAGWNQFKSDKYGFEFNYPSSWGKPTVSTTKGKTGTFYQVSFGSSSGQTATKSSALINMFSKDYVNALCSASDCSSQKSLDSQQVINSLKNSSKLFIKHDDSSYATINYSPSAHGSTLLDTQIINVPKLNVTAAAGLYTFTGATSCPIGKFAAATQTGCINNGNYNTFNKVMKSIQAL